MISKSMNKGSFADAINPNPWRPGAKMNNTLKWIIEMLRRNKKIKMKAFIIRALEDIITLRFQSPRETVNYTELAAIAQEANFHSGC